MSGNNEHQFKQTHCDADCNQVIDKKCSPSYFIAGTLVLTIDGYKEIQLVSESDTVYTHLGSWKSIRNRQSQIYEGLVTSIYSAGSNIPIKATVNHLFLIKTIIFTNHYPNDFKMSETTSWTPASSLIAGKHSLCIPIEKIERPVQIDIIIDSNHRSPNNIDWFMVGYYLGKGNNPLEIEFIPPGWSILREFTSNPNIESTVCSHIPEWLQKLPIRDIGTLIRGFEKSSIGDRCFSVANENVAMHIQRLYAKLNRFVSIYVDDDTICLREVDNMFVSFDDQYMYIPVDAVFNETKLATMYNIELTDNNSYVVENVVTKRCS